MECLKLLLQLLQLKQSFVEGGLGLCKLIFKVWKCGEMKNKRRGMAKSHWCRIIDGGGGRGSKPISIAMYVLELGKI